jgi:nucleotide-binding universal stress UspA family protein
MRTVLATLDTSAAARPVLEAALGIAQLTGATVEAVHVHDGSTDTPESLATRSGVPFRLLDGPTEQALLDALASPEVVAAVLGARATPGGRRPTGHTALRVLERASKPVVVVPPEAVGVSPRPFHRLLVPLDGTAAASRPVTERLCPLIVGDVELLVLHVFTADTMPRVLDRPERDLELLGGEFLARYCPGATQIELRTGSVGSQVEAACRDEDADLIVLSWSQDISAGHAAVIRDVLSHAAVPVLLLPVDDAPVIDLDAVASRLEDAPTRR